MDIRFGYSLRLNILDIRFGYSFWIFDVDIRFGKLLAVHLHIVDIFVV
ncbi:hypothetical protein BB050_02851 [Flavobacterium anhuiense]|uniref:Uncharacterized protein n=1 Tax=Flavobacterium anhuiense TaxID=459526 RepID=A0AAC9D1K3_9FLAO|nr:hypothetical protein BB050_02851 [Flavobacterium anhuiense]